MKFFVKPILFFSCFAALFSGIQEAEAQDPRYSQYYNAPARLNPALAGLIDGSMRLGFNYRSQWGTILGKAYNSGSFTADGKLAVLKDDFVGLGFNAMYDRSGSTAYQVMDIGIDANFQKKLYQGRGYKRNHQSFLIAGAHLGFGQRTVDWNSLTYSTQYVVDNNSYNQSLNSGESANVRQNKIYPDLSAGLLWWGSMGNRKNAFGGFAIHHLNRPDVSLFNRPPVDTSGNSFSTPVEKLYMRITGHAGAEILLGDKSSVSLLPGVVTQFQGPSTEINFGVSMKYQQPRYDDFALTLGVWNRLASVYKGLSTSSIGADALIFMAGLDYNNLKFMLSYDATISSLSPQNNGRGSMEVSVQYLFDFDQRRQQGCPAF